MSKIFAAMMNTSETEPEFSFIDKEASASEHSFSSIVGIVPKHAESSLRIMEEYLDKQQLTDVVLIAGITTFSLLYRLNYQMIRPD